MQIVVKSVWAVLGSDLAGVAFQTLDRDNDGRLTANEVSNDFCNEMLVPFYALAAASPFLNEIRAKDQEIAALKAKLAALGGDASEFVSPDTTQVEISQQEFTKFINHMVGWQRYGAGPGEIMDGRVMLSKLSHLGFKVCTKMLFKLTQIPMTNEHDPASFFAAWKSTWVDILHDLKTALGPLIKALPKGRWILDIVHAKVQAGHLDKEIRAFSDSVFKLLDQDADNKISPADAAIYTNLIFEPCLDDESAKKKFLAIFDNLDINKDGSLSQDELSSFVSKIVNLAGAAMVFKLAVVEVCIAEQADKEIRSMMDFYIKDCQETKFREVHALRLASTSSSNHIRHAQ